MSEERILTSSATNLALGLASLGAGAYHGYCDAQGIEFERENMEWALTYGPTIFRGAVGVAVGGLVGLVGGGVVGAMFIRDNCDSGVKTVAKTAVGFATLGGVVEATKGTIQTLIGYGAGYFAGWALK